MSLNWLAFPNLKIKRDASAGCFVFRVICTKFFYSFLFSCLASLQSQINENKKTFKKNQNPH